MAQLEAKLGRPAKDKEVAASLGISKDEFEYSLLEISRTSIATLDERWTSFGRIEGAIIDELRSLDWMPPSMRARAREIERATRQLEPKLADPPTDEEVAASLGISEDELKNSRREMSRMWKDALDERWRSSPVGGDRASQSGLHDIDKEISRLPKQERLLVILSYYEMLTKREIEAMLRQPGVAQLQTKAILRLNARLTVSRPHADQD